VARDDAAVFVLVLLLLAGELLGDVRAEEEGRGELWEQEARDGRRGVDPPAALVVGDVGDLVEICLTLLKLEL